MLTDRSMYIDLDDICRLFCEILYVAESSTSDIKLIKAVRQMLDKHGYFICLYRQQQLCSFTKEKYDKNLALKLSELTRILNNNALNGRLTEQFHFYKRNKKLQAVIEMLILDIISILDSSKNNIENNLLFLDDNAPLLTGKCLRNHLAHDNPLVDVLLTDRS